jgi:hypothetical protein
MNIVNIQAEVSMLLSESGVHLYINDDSLPSYSVGIMHLVDDYIDAYAVDNRIEGHEQANTILIINELRSALEKLAHTLRD